MMAPEQLTYALAWALWAAVVAFVYFSIAWRDGKPGLHRRAAAAVLGAQGALAALIAAVMPPGLARDPVAYNSVRAALAACAACCAFAAVMVARGYRPFRTLGALAARRDRG